MSKEREDEGACEGGCLLCDELERQALSDEGSPSWPDEDTAVLETAQAG